MKVICAGCGALIREIPRTRESDPIFGVCATCKAKLGTMRAAGPRKSTRNAAERQVAKVSDDSAYAGA